MDPLWGKRAGGTALARERPGGGRSLCVARADERILGGQSDAIATSTRDASMETCWTRALLPDSEASAEEE